MFILGDGCYASKSFQKGEFLLEYRGQLITEDEAMRREKVQGNRTWLFYFSQNGITKWYVKGNFLLYIYIDIVK